MSDNALTVDTIFFDPMKAQIRIGWSIDSLFSDEQIDVGMCYSLGKVPSDTNGIQAVHVNALSMDTTLLLKESILR